MSAAATPSPWLSINDMLINNRCWFCREPFQRGKTKKAFQLTHIIDFFIAVSSNLAISHTIEQEDADTKMENITENKTDNSDVQKTETQTFVPKTLRLENIKSVNLRQCLEHFMQITNGDANKVDDLVKHLKENDLEVWMSGLACCKDEACKEEVSWVLPATDYSNTTTTTNKTSTAGKFLNGKNCPPGCGCDNPWPFLS